MISQRKSLGKLIVEYEVIDKEDTTGDNKSPRKLLPVGHKSSTFQSFFGGPVEPVREDNPVVVFTTSSNQSTKSDSSLSSTETLKPSTTTTNNNAKREVSNQKSNQLAIDENENRETKNVKER